MNENAVYKQWQQQKVCLLKDVVSAAVFQQYMSDKLQQLQPQEIDSSDVTGDWEQELNLCCIIHLLIA